MSLERALHTAKRPLGSTARGSSGTPERDRRTTDNGQQTTAFSFAFMLDLSRFDNNSFARGAPRWKEIAWWICRSLCFAPWFPVPSPLKVAVLRFFGARIGRGVVIRSRVNITMPWRFECGDHVWIGDEVLVLSLDRVVVGSNVCISQRAFLCTGNHDFRKETFDLVTKPIAIGDGCWVGAGAFVGPGVTMGSGSQCLAGAVVVRDVEAGSTVGGVPAKEVNHQGTDDAQM